MGKWEEAQRAAELARVAARSHLENKGLAWGEGAQTKVTDERDNTLELVRKRKAEAAVEALNAHTASGETQKAAQPQQAGAAQPLPEGWEIAREVDFGQDGKHAGFRHAGSGCITLVRPQKGVSKDLSQAENIKIPQGWKTLKDPESGNMYYWNHSSKTVQWEIPIQTNESEGGAASLILKETIDSTDSNSQEGIQSTNEVKAGTPSFNGMILLKKKKK